MFALTVRIRLIWFHLLFFISTVENLVFSYFSKKYKSVFFWIFFLLFPLLSLFTEKYQVHVILVKIMTDMDFEFQTFFWGFFYAVLPWFNAYFKGIIYIYIYIYIYKFRTINVYFTHILPHTLFFLKFLKFCLI